MPSWVRVALAILTLFIVWPTILLARILPSEPVTTRPVEQIEPLHAGPPQGLQSSGTINQSQYDVLHYELDLYPDFDTEELSASVDVQFKSLANGLSHMELDLYGSWQVTEVAAVAETITIQLAWVHLGDLLYLQFSAPMSAGQEGTIRVTYEGVPPFAGFLGMQFLGNSGEPTLATLSEPFYARSWWPCKDLPDDKATVELACVVPDNMYCASNGTLQSSFPYGGDSIRYVWEETYPISTYMVSVAAAEYVGWQETYVAEDGTNMPVDYWVFPEDEVAARVDFERTVPMIEFFADLFGEYPFLDEKYGIAEFLVEAGVEHPTMTSYGKILITGDKFFEHLVAHELSHQWWGDLLTLSDWDETWLHEGFAEYCGGLWREHVDGINALHSYMNSRANDANFKGPIVPPNNRFGNTVYWKGAWVLHMLRHVMGDQPFFTAMHDFAADPSLRYGNVTSDDFAARVSTTAGTDMTWFFDQWLYRVGRPDYLVSWSTVPMGGNHLVTATIEQRQEGDVYTMPIDLTFDTASGSTSFLVWNDTQVQEFVVTLDELPTQMCVDPDGWLLAWIEVVGGGSCAAAIPEAPANLTLSALGSSEIRLDWTDLSDDEFGFYIERDAGAGFEQIATVDPNLTHYTDRGLQCSKYTYRVSSFKTAGPSAPTPAVSSKLCRPSSQPNSGDGNPDRWKSATGGRAIFEGVQPNPFNPRTTLRFGLAAAGRLELTVYDVGGRLVTTLLDEDRAAGKGQVEWDGTDSSGRRVASGIYHAVMRVDGSLVGSRRLALLK